MTNRRKLLVLVKFRHKLNPITPTKNYSVWPFDFKTYPKENLKNFKTANFMISEKILKSPTKKQQIHEFELTLKRVGGQNYK